MSTTPLIRTHLDTAAKGTNRTLDDSSVNENTFRFATFDFGRKSLPIRPTSREAAPICIRRLGHWRTNCGPRRFDYRDQNRFNDSPISELEPQSPISRYSECIDTLINLYPIFRSQATATNRSPPSQSTYFPYVWSSIRLAWAIRIEYWYSAAATRHEI